MHNSCTIEGCNTASSKEGGGRRGLCFKHYKRWRLGQDLHMRTRYTPNEIVLDESVAYVYLYDRKGNYRDKTTIDVTDVSLVGSFKWALSTHGYAVTHNRLTKKQLSLTSLLLEPAKGFEVDHINGDTRDNRRSNLRVCERWLNNKNRKMESVSGLKGVRFNAGKWQVAIWYDGKNHYLGRFDTPEEALNVYEAAQKKRFPNYIGR